MVPGVEMVGMSSDQDGDDSEDGRRREFHGGRQQGRDCGNQTILSVFHQN